jgi:hypothetical protein
MEAAFHLPSGASIVSFEIEACDSVAANYASALYRNPNNGSFVVLGGLSSSGTPGCVTQLATLTTPETVDNANNTYMFEWNDGGANASGMALRAVRVRYRLQLSPAPAVATFNDVPTNHIFFRFIEALAASGITGGCNNPPGAFCPDAAVTRGQMAAFLSIALGLHFPN